MSVFFEYATDLQSLQKGAITCTAFSNGDQHILAAATKNGDISLFLEEGEHLEPEAGLRRAGECTHMHWHPKLSLLASGWDDGTVSVWGEKERVSREESSTHKAPITLLTFSPDGGRLLSGDANGLLAVWSVDHRGRLALVCKYEKKGAITHLVFRAPASSAASAEGNNVCPSFFFGGASGIIVFADDAGHSSDVIKTGSPLSTMHYSSARDYLVLVTADVVLFKYAITADGKMKQERKVKLSIKGDGRDLQVVFAGNGLLAAANSEPLVRLWSLESEDNYTLSLTDPAHRAIPKDVVTCLAFNAAKRCLVAGTLAGRVVQWKFHGRAGSDPSDQDWEPLPPVETNYGGSGSGLGVQKVTWGPGEGLLAVRSAEGLSLLLETTLASKYLPSTGASLLQTGSDCFSLQTSGGRVVRVQAGVRVKGFDMTAKYILVFNGRRAEVREVPPDGGEVKLVSSFATKASRAVLAGESIYAAVGGRVEVLSLSGVFKSALAFTEAEGHPVFLAAEHGFMSCVTSHNHVKLWDITRREPKTVVPGRVLGTGEGERDLLRGLQVRQVAANVSGTKLALLAHVLEGDEVGGVQTPDSRVHVYDVELDRVFSHEFGPRHYPVRVQWDAKESKLLAVETRKFEVQPKEASAAGKAGEEKKGAPGGAAAADERKEDLEADDGGEGGDSGEGGASGNGGALGDSVAPAEVTTLFATSDYGVLMQDSFPIDAGGGETLMALQVPHVLFMTRPGDEEYEHSGSSGALPHIKRRVMRDFVGLEEVNEDTKRDLLAFSYFLTVGNMDEAYRAVKKISQTTIWENMAHMCVKTRRLDVAEVCLGNMGNARGAKAVREAKKEPEKEAQVAMLAIQLNLLDDAERLYKECGRYDLLVQLYTASGRWKDALKVCAKYSRIHLKTTHYQYARHLEHLGDTVNAIKNYEKSETHRSEVPRMLFDSHHIADLEAYIKASDDAALTKWWASYCESNGSYDEAIKYYDLAKETLALVRVYCYRNEDDKAARVCNESGDMAACYHLARQYEQQERIPDAIHFYKLSKRYNHGIRLAKEHFLDGELLTLALECSSKELKVDAARFFEQKNELDKAVLLYQKGGKIPRALELCFKGQLFDSLRTISENLGPETSPELLAKCGEFFFSHGQFEKAVHLFITARQYLKALTLCMKHNVKITEAMAEKMTPPKSKDEAEKKAREDLLKKLAHCCKDQGEYQLACKKYTQSGDYVRAMKCLLKSSDTEKISSYATMTKQKEIYILAANYLQNLDWHNDPEIMKRIINFYTLAKAMAQLAVFYDACAQVEIDEYRDYEKALGALQDSQKFLIKGKDIPQRDEKMANLDGRIRLVQRFVDARKCVKSNPNEMIDICNGILDAGDVESAIRVGDVYALLIEYFHSVGEYQRAYGVIERMRAANIILSPYLDQAMVQRIHSECGQQMQPEGAGGQWTQQGAGQVDEGGIGEEINEEV